MKQPLIILLLLLTFGAAKAQEIKNIEVKQEGDNIILSFNLLPKESTREQYSLRITSSKDNYNALINVDKPTNDVKPTNRLSYVISGNENFGGFSGDVDFQIEATLVYTPLRVVTPNNRVTVKKGKPMNVQWEGGNKDDKYNVDLYKAGTKVFALNSSFAKTATTWTVPEDTKPGKDYKVKITSKKNPNQAVFTQDFNIKGKTSIMIKLLPVAALGGLAAVLLGGKSKDTGNGDLPAPPVID